MVLLVNLTIGTIDTSIDSYGHLGGLIVGVLSGLFLFPVIPGQDDSNRSCQDKGRKVGQIGCIIFFVVGFVLFYTIRNPTEEE
jgi:hypothetical protein